MISEFERALADALGARLPVPFGGRVDVSPGTGTTPAILLGAERVEVVQPDLGSRRPEVVPGSADGRRVLRASCTVGLVVVPADGGGRQQQAQGLDAALYALDAPEFRDGSVLASPGDPGFLIGAMRVLHSTAPLDPAAAEAPSVGITLRADGWFWPVGLPSQAGMVIGTIRLRSAVLPIEVAPARPDLRAGGPAADLSIRIRSAGAFREVADGTLQPIPIGPLALVLARPGGRPGAGTLTGGTAGSAGARLVNVTEGEAAVGYAPPAESGTDTLVVALDDGEGGPGIELGRFPLVVREG